MIACGLKKEEYRTIKPYWTKRLMESDSSGKIQWFKDFDIIRFRNGYSKDAPTIDVEFKGVCIGEPKPNWSANAKGPHYCLQIGEILERSVSAEGN